MYMDSKNSAMVAGEIEALLRRQQELVTQLRALILPPLHGVDGGRPAELALQLFEDVIGCNTSVVSRLLQGSLFSSGAGGPAVVEHVVDDKSKVRRKSTSVVAGERLEEQTKHIISSVAQKRSRRRNDGKRSRSLVTNVPHYDGHQWRKYGQKNINGRQHPRSYYRCAYRERNCSATKTIQQHDQTGTFNYGDETAKYTVVYYGHHNCKGGSVSNANMDLRSGEMAWTATETQVFEGDLDVPALLEVLDNSMLNWEITC